MEKQINFADIEYGNRRRKTKREEFPEKMESVIPWGKWVEIIEPYYPDGKRGRRPQSIERMLRITFSGTGSAFRTRGQRTQYTTAMR